MFEKYKVLLWDFDGVIMDSNPIRTHGFEEVLKPYPADQVKKLIDFHKQNGGLPRYDKFRYFFETIRGEQADDKVLKQLLNQFGKIMQNKLMNPALLINDSVAFIKANYKNFIMHIVSGSDQAELRQICGAMELSQYFVSIVGSPTLKPELTRQVMQQYGYDHKQVAFIGDSINDYDAAKENEIDFMGYNNESLRKLSVTYIDKFKV